MVKISARAANGPISSIPHHFIRVAEKWCMKIVERNRPTSEGGSSNGRVNCADDSVTSLKTI